MRKNIFSLKNKYFFFKGFAPILVLVVTAVALNLLLSVERKPYRGRLNEGDVSLTALYAPFNFSYPGSVDEEKTAAKRQENASKVALVYSVDQNVIQGALARSDAFFKNLKEVKALSLSTSEKVSRLNQASGLDLPESTIKIFLSQEAEKSIDSLSADAKNILMKVFDKGILSQEEKERIQKTGSDTFYIKDTQGQKEQVVDFKDVYISSDLKEPLVILVSESFPDSRRTRSCFVELTGKLLAPDLVLDEAETQKRKEEAVKNTPLQYKTIEMKRGELIINKGERVKKEHIQKLDALDSIQGGTGGIGYLGGQSIVVVLFLLSIWAYMYFFERKILSTANLAIVCSLIIFIALCARITILTPLPTYFIPLASATILISILLSPRLSIIAAFALGAIVSNVSGDKFSAFLVLVIGAAVGAFAARKIRRRSQVIKAGVYVGIVNFICIASVGMMNYLQPSIYIKDAFWGIANGMASIAIVMIFLPIYEFLFGLTTDIRLLEIADSNHPLLKEMIIKAPGTYHHSLIVGNLAEAACEEIGANSLLARVAAYYHDIGKIENADYFSENQPRQESRHEKLTPTMSCLIIINHVKKGIELAKKYKLNKKIVDMIPQHHGTSVMHYFYQRALEEIEDVEQIQEEVFRYPGPKPQSKEAAVILLADSVEAASRTITNPTVAKINQIVRMVINNKFIDGQLDECDLTLKDLHKIADAFGKVLSGVFHTRISDINKEEKKKEIEDRSTEQTKQNQG